MATSTDNSNSSQTPSETALILEHIELLMALYEDQGEHGPTNFGELLDTKANEIATKVEAQIEKRFEQLEDRFERITESITKQNATLESLGNSDIAGAGSVNAEEQCRLVEHQLEQATAGFNDRTDALAGLFKVQTEQMFDDLRSKVTKLSQDSGQQPVELEASAPSNSDDSASHWHKQKEAMLSKYGIDPDYRPVMELPETGEPGGEEVEHVEIQPIETMSEADAAEIEELKEMLNAKMRDAEVELSISRAKICQQQAEMEEEQVELDRRAAAIEEKYAAVARAPKRRMGLFRWLWHHLKPKQPEVNDRA